MGEGRDAVPTPTGEVDGGSLVHCEPMRTPRPQFDYPSKSGAVIDGEQTTSSNGATWRAGVAAIRVYGGLIHLPNCIRQLQLFLCRVAVRPVRCKSPIGRLARRVRHAADIEPRSSNNPGGVRCEYRAALV